MVDLHRRRYKAGSWHKIEACCVPNHSSLAIINTTIWFFLIFTILLQVLKIEISKYYNFFTMQFQTFWHRKLLFTTIAPRSVNVTATSACYWRNREHLFLTYSKWFFTLYTNLFYFILILDSRINIKTAWALREILVSGNIGEIAFSSTSKCYPRTLSLFKNKSKRLCKKVLLFLVLLMKFCKVFIFISFVIRIDFFVPVFWLFICI